MSIINHVASKIPAIIYCKQIIEERVIYIIIIVLTYHHQIKFSRNI